jgi:hypothetical protein
MLALKCKPNSPIRVYFYLQGQMRWIDVAIWIKSSRINYNAGGALIYAMTGDQCRR